MRLIDADALKREFEATPYNDYDDLLRTERLIDEAPTIDKGYDFGYADGHGEGYELGKNSRPHGKWRDGYGGEYLCTNCFAHSESPTPFCRHCGADMRGEEE